MNSLLSCVCVSRSDLHIDSARRRVEEPNRHQVRVQKLHFLPVFMRIIKSCFLQNEIVRCFFATLYRFCQTKSRRTKSPPSSCSETAFPPSIHEDYQKLLSPK